MTLPQLTNALELLEEIEALEMGIVEELESVPRKTHRSKLAQECRLANMMKAAETRAKRLKQSEEERGVVGPQGGLQEFLRRKAELAPPLPSEEREEPQTIARVAAWGGREIPCATEEDARLIFRPKTRAERRLARSRIDDFVLEQTCSFTGEEAWGRFLDLHHLHLDFQNLNETLRGVSYLDYLRKYVGILPPPGGGGLDQGDGKIRYSRYLKRLREHLLDFERRARPLSLPPPKSEEEEAPCFEQVLRDAQSSAELASKLDMNQLKQALAERGLKVGGTLQQRAERLFKVRDCARGEYPAELQSGAAAILLPTEREERVIRQALARLQTILSATITMITKKLIMTFEEIEAEKREALLEEAERSDAEEEADEFDDSADSAQLQQTGKVDPSTGRIIPKWMYRLHGLNQEFRCEICGNHAYFGRRAYDRHFKDFRHANGMKALGIPNTAHFLDITSIADARNLYNNLRAEAKRRELQRESEEFEDAQGNVMTRKTYEDLKREGLL